jgi:L-threonylcarbamoyladenylate synthase
VTLESVEKAIALLRGGGVVALPTDTLYALAADALHAGAVGRVYAIKGREEGKPLPLFVSDIVMAERFVMLNGMARRLATRFWPGALTIVLPRRSNLVSDALAGGDTVAVRAPDHATVLTILDLVDGPLTATSANRSGGPDPLSAEEVRSQLGGEVDFVLDGGACPGGVASTIVDCTGDEPKVLRAGAVSEAEIRAALIGMT